MMVGFGIVAFYRWQQTQLIFFLLLVLRDFAAGCFFFRRKPAHSRGSRTLTILAYASSAMPLLYFGSTVSSKALFLVSDLLAILGFLLVVLATVELGRSIGISPANRGHVRSGIYRYIKHPMYAGYILSEIGLSLINPFNAILLLVSTTLYYFRAKAEVKQFQINDI